MQDRARIMMFVDGDNLLYRFQSMVGNGAAPQNTVTHERDRYVWCWQVAVPGLPDLMRAYYYVSIVGDEVEQLRVAEKIKSLRPSSIVNTTAQSFSPFVFKKDKQSDKAKGVDIRLTVDAMTGLWHNNYEILWLFTGDADYLPVMEEAVRFGRTVCVAALSSGLSPKLRQKADHFLNLDDAYFLPKP
jgi:hypothetical protein